MGSAAREGVREGDCRQETSTERYCGRAQDRRGCCRQSCNDRGRARRKGGQVCRQTHMGSCQDAQPRLSHDDARTIAAVRSAYRAASAAIPRASSAAATCAGARQNIRPRGAARGSKQAPVCKSCGFVCVVWGVCVWGGGGGEEGGRQQLTRVRAALMLTATVAGRRATHKVVSAVNWPSCDGIEPTSRLSSNFLRISERRPPAGVPA